MTQSSEPLTDLEREEGSTLFVRAREFSSSEHLAALRQWVGGDPRRQRLVDDLERIWGALSSVQEDPRMARMRAEAALEIARPVRVANRMGWAIAASAALALAMTAAVLLGDVWRPTPRDEYVTAMGERKNFVLADGSTVHADSVTRLSVSFDDDERVVRLLEGQATFDVSHDPNRPFHVEAGDNDVKALGTRFNVAFQTRRPTISLFDGSVLVSAIDKEAGWLGLGEDTVRRPLATLEPGQQFAYDQSDNPTVQRFDSEAVTAWEDGRIVFSGLMLDEAVAIVNRYSVRKVEIDPALAGATMTGVFDTGDAMQFAQAVLTYFPGSAIDVDDSRILIRAAK